LTPEASGDTHSLKSKNSASYQNRIPNLPTSDRPDVYVALVAPTGTDLGPVREALLSGFATYGYKTHNVKVSSLLASYYAVDTSDMAEDERIRKLMNLGDRMRKDLNRGDATVTLITNFIRQLRSSLDETDDGLAGSQCFIVDSLKNTAELKALDQVYGRNLYAISIFSDFDSRLQKIARRIADKTGVSVNSGHLEKAQKIISDDQDRGDPKFSQDVLNTFPQSDFFVNSDGQIDRQIKRFVDLIFGKPYVTPKLDEYGMFIAKASSFRSCDLSRQVGAAIMDEAGSIVSTGCNEVPTPGGGFFFEGRPSAIDNRDYKIGYDPNYQEIQEAITEVIQSLSDEKLLSEKFDNQISDVIAADLLHGGLKHVLKDTRIRSLIEFGRVVHAEMHAISDAARRGVSVEGKTLYCTTFPCHMCARHVLAAGLKRVVYIEPYPKSLTSKLYSAEVSFSFSDTDPSNNRVVFTPFMGVAPTLFQRAFDHRSGKTRTGAAAEFDKTSAKPTRAVPGVARLTLEKAYSALTVPGDTIINKNDSDGRGTDDGTRPDNSAGRAG
jgi:deoxycytidylate deaminase